MTGVPAGTPLHPTQLYLVGANLVICGILVLVLRRRRFPGQVMLSQFILYGIVRFIVEFFRDDPRGFLPGGLSTSQGIAILAIALSLVGWRYLSRRPLPDSIYYATSRRRRR
jgi:phosphatidylglycerol:prolipoprotein diacylglycerol transferase